MTSAKHGKSTPKSDTPCENALWENLGIPRRWEQLGFQSREQMQEAAPLPEQFERETLLKFVRGELSEDKAEEISVACAMSDDVLRVVTRLFIEHLGKP